MSNYAEALEAAGATVHAFEEFGSYQGDWFAKVTLPDGREGFIHDYYGSCTGCDAFEAEFGSRWSNPPSKEEIADFGRRYFDQLLTKEEALAEAAQHIAWDVDAQAMVDWVKAQ